MLRNSRYFCSFTILMMIILSLMVMTNVCNQLIKQKKSYLCNPQMADNESISFSTSKSSIPRERREMVRPLARKDIFYSGSVMNLPEFKSQKSLSSYRQSVISLPKYAQERGDIVDIEKGSRLRSICINCLVTLISNRQLLPTSQYKS